MDTVYVYFAYVLADQLIFELNYKERIFSKWSCNKTF